MISSGYRFIYLHAPKTGGNSIQSCLLPFSDDAIVLGGHQDGVDRFEIQGSVTPTKHALLTDYAAALGEQIADFKIAMSVRHPFERAVSFYFSPHRWLRRNDQGPGWIAIEPEWSIEAFSTVLGKMAAMSSFITVGDELRMPDFLIRYETFRADFARFVSTIGVPLENTELPHRNVSAAPLMQARTLHDSEARLLVEKRFAKDFEIFGY